ncbi:hypothetical protein ACFQZC_21970 [Streptacidiphilus monticola]
MHRRRTVRNAVRAALAGLGVLGLVLTGAASASAAAPRVDVRTTLTLDTPRIAPGKVLLLDAETQLLRGTLGHFAVVVHLPRGLRYLHDQNSPDCRSSADHRTVWCPSYPGSGWAGSQLHVQVSRGIRPGTVESITAAASIGRAVDPTPADNTARARLLVKAGSDFGLSWITPKQPLHPGAAPWSPGWSSPTTAVTVPSRPGRTST